MITAAVQDIKTVAPMLTGAEPPELFNGEDLPKIVTRLYPDLSAEEARVVANAAHTEMVIHSNGGLIKEEDLPPGIVISGEEKGSEGDAGDSESSKHSGSNQEFLKVGEKFINIEDLNIDLISQVNPFQGAYEIISKSVDAPMLRTIQDMVVGNRSGVSEEEAMLMWPNIKKFVRETGYEPRVTSSDPYEKRLAEVYAYVRQAAAKRAAEKAAAAKRA